MNGEKSGRQLGQRLAVFPCQGGYDAFEAQITKGAKTLPKEMGCFLHGTFQ